MDATLRPAVVSDGMSRVPPPDDDKSKVIGEVAARRTTSVDQMDASGAVRDLSQQVADISRQGKIEQMQKIVERLFGNDGKMLTKHYESTRTDRPSGLR